MSISWLDASLAIYLMLHLLTGYQQGFFLGGLSFASLIGALGFGVAGGPRLASWCGLHSAIASLVLAALVFAALKLAQGRLVRAFGPVLAAYPRWQALDRYLGLLPGLAWGALGGGLVAWFVTAFAGGLPAHSPVAVSLLATMRAPLATFGHAIPVPRER